MQVKIKSQPYDTFASLYDGAFEAPVEMEFDLPDYCPDVRKVLKCQSTPELTRYELGEDALTCEGVCEFRVLYLDGKNDALRCCTFTREFSASVKTKPGGENGVAWVRAAMGRVHCRAVNARRLELRAAVTLRALAVVRRRELVACEAEDASVERLRSVQPAVRAVNAISHRFTVEDSCALKNGKPPVDAILRKSVTFRLLDHRLEEDRLTVTGAMDVTFLYLSPQDGDPVESMNFSVDFTQILEVPEATEHSFCDLKLTAGECPLALQEDDMGEYTSVKVTGHAFLTAFVYEPCQLEILDDVYSVSQPLELKYAQVRLLSAQGVHRESFRQKVTFPLEQDLDRVLDLWCEGDSVEPETAGEKTLCRVRTTLCLLGRSADGRTFYTEKTLDACVDASPEMAGGQRTVGKAEIWEYRLPEKNTVEVSVEFRTETFPAREQPVRCLASAAWEEDGEPLATVPGLTLYYARQGQRVWDIAKEHRALLADLRQQNQLEEDVLTRDQPLLITTR